METTTLLSFSALGTEWSLNSGWMDIATKISVFINAKAQPIGKTSHRKTEKGLLYSDIVRTINGLQGN